MAVPAAVLSVLVQANTGGATRGLMRFNSQLGGTETKANRATRALGTFSKVGVIGAGIGLGYAVKKAADFEQQLDSLGSVSGASGRQMEQFRKQAMKAGADTKFSALDAAEAQTELAKGGLKVRQIMRGGLKSALALAAAGEMELGEAAATTANALNLFGLEGKNSMKVADALAKAANATTADVTDFAMALRQSGGVAKTAGLSFTETVLALESLANAGTKNSDAGTSLKTALIQLIKPTEKQSALSKKLNLEFIDAQGNFKGLADISTMLRDRLGGMTAAQRTATLATLAGTDGVRTLTSLYDAGPKKLDKWKKGLNESGTAAEVAAKKQDNLKGKLENLQGSIETVAIGLGSKLLPALTKAAEQVTDVINDPKLTSTEKFDKLGAMFAKAIGDAAPVVAKAAAAVGLVATRAFFSAFRESPLWAKLLGGAFLLSKLGGFSAFKKVGQKAGVEMATGVSQGAATGAKGGAVAGRFSGMAGAFRTVGRNVLGVALAAGVIDGMTRADIGGSDRVQQALSTFTAGLVPAPETFSAKLQKAINDALKGGSPRFEGFDQFISSLDEGLDAKGKAIIHKLGDLRRQAIKTFGPDVKLNPQVALNPDKAIKALRRLDNEFGRMKQGSILSIRELRQVTANNAKAIAEVLGTKSKDGTDAMRKNFKAGVSAVKTLMKSGQITTGQASKEIARLLKVHSGAGKDALKKNFREAREFIGATMRNSKGITQEGMSAIRQIFAQELKLYGLSKESIKFRLQGKEQSGKTIGAPLVNKQRGGPINMGAPSGDTVPAMLERGEYVMNRNAVSKVGAKALDRINFGMAPRFQGGGMVRVPGDPNLTGGRDLMNKSVAPLAAFLIKLGNMEIGYAYDPGGGHQSPGHNVTGTAMDVVPAGNDPGWERLEKAIRWATNRGMTVYYDGQAGSTPLENHGEGNHAHFELASGNPGSKFPQIAGPGRDPKIARQVITGGEDSPLRAVAQNALDKTRSGALAKLKRLAAPMQVEGSDPGGMPGQFTGGGTEAQNRALGLKMAKARGWGGANWRALDQLWQGESHWDEGVANYEGSGAYGIAQALPASKYPPAGQPSAPNGPAKAQAQIKWGLDYIAGRYGNPVKALAFWNAQSPHWYQKGGLIQGMQEGGSVSYPLGVKGANLGGPSAHKARPLGNWESDNAVDIGVPIGTAVKALSSGKISKIAGSWDGGGGQTSGIQVHFTNPNTQWFYTHLKKMNASVGTQLQPGQNFGLSGAGNGVPHLHLGKMSGNPEQVLNWPILSGTGGNGKSGPDPAKKGKATGPHPIGKLAYVGDSLGVGTLGAGLKKKLGKIGLASNAVVGKPSPWGVDAIKPLLGGAGAAMFDLGTNDGTVSNLRPSISAVKGMLKGRPLVMASLDPQSTDVAKKNAAIRSMADVVVPWAGQAQKFASDKVHPTGAGYTKRANMIAEAVKALRTKGEATGKDPLPKALTKTLKHGPIGKAFKKTLKFLRRTGNKKLRAKALRGFERRIKKVSGSIPEGLQKQISALTEDAAIYDEFASRASSLTGDEEGSPLGVVGGKTEGEWLQAELAKLFQLRNKLIEAQEVIEKRRKQVADLLERARERLIKIKDKIEENQKQAKKVKKHLDQMQKHPKQHRAEIKKAKNELDNLEKNTKGLKNEQSGLKDSIIPALRGKATGLAAARTELNDPLSTVQGLGAPMGRLTALPALGVLGGSIFDVQMRLRELAAPATAITDGSSAEPSESAELLKELLREANLRTAVSQKQYEVFKNFPAYGGEFATGGVVPGPIGAARTIVAHGGETVTPPGNGGANVQINFGPGMDWLEKFIEVKVDGVTRKQARGAARSLPGRGGGI